MSEIKIVGRTQSDVAIRVGNTIHIVSADTVDTTKKSTWIDDKAAHIRFNRLIK